MLANTAFALILFTQAPFEESPPGLRESIKVSLAKNVAKGSRGRARFVVEERHVKLDKKWNAVVELTWDGDDYETRVSLEDPYGVVDDPSTERRQRDFLHTRSHVYAYTKDAASVVVLDRTAKADRDQRFDLRPKAVWTRTSPPVFLAGRDWSEVLDLVGFSAIKPPVSAKMTKDGNLVRFVRNDGRGGELEAIFSPEKGGNLVSHQFRNRIQGSATGDRSSQREWTKHDSGVYYLSKLRQTDYVPRSDRVDWIYELKTESISFDPPPSGYLTEKAFFARLPASTRIVDQTWAGRERSRFTIDQKVGDTR